MPRTPPPRDIPPPRLYDFVRHLDPATPSMPVIVADSIAEQIDALPQPDGVAIGSEPSPPASAYGVVAPPFPEFFVEVQTWLDAPYQSVPAGWIQRGCLVTDLTPQMKNGEISSQISAAAPAATAWLMAVSAFIRTSADKGIQSYEGFALLHIDGSGHLLDDTEQISIISTAPHTPRAQQMRHAAGVASHIPYLLKALSALHGKTYADKITPSEEAQRLARRTHGVPLNEHYTLHINTANQPTSMAQVGHPTRGEAEARRAHSVRGHFRTYTPDRPMFGRVVGTVWIAEHERGDSGLGTIGKDYELN